VKIFHLFWTTFIVGAFTFGGGYVIIPILKGQLVDKLRWVSNQDFAFAIAVGQLTPGPISVLVAVLGWKVAGIPGATAATIGLFLPAFLVVIWLSHVYSKIRNHPRVQGVMMFIYPAIGALLISVVIDFSKELWGTGWVNLIVAVVSFALMSFTSLSPACLFAGCIVWGVLAH
jgi:chromate transporter